MATTRNAKPVALCVVTVHHLELLMPADKGMKLVELLQHCQQVQQHYEPNIGRFYAPRNAADIEVEYRAIKASQVRPNVEAQGRPAKGQTLLLGNDL